MNLELSGLDPLRDGTVALVDVLETVGEVVAIDTAYHSFVVAQVQKLEIRLPN